MLAWQFQFAAGVDGSDFLLTKILHDANNNVMPMIEDTRINVFIGIAFVTR
jgi:hypothetical protein